MIDVHKPTPTAVADSAAADSVVNGGAREITQADRDAAASVAVLVEMRELIRAGRADHHAEPFARHREAALDTAAPLIRAQIADWLVKQPPHLSLQEYAAAIAKTREG